MSSPLKVFSPADGALITEIKTDSTATLSNKIAASANAQNKWKPAPHSERVVLVEAYSAALKNHHEELAKLVTHEAGKTNKEALTEVDGAADILIKTIKDITLPELNGMLRRKERDALGVVGLITSFNFPIAVAHWTIAPALLAGNSVVWKPSEKTPLVAQRCKEIFDSVAGQYKGLLQLAIGARDIGELLVGDERTALISATGSVGMGLGIRNILAARKTPPAPSILELGGNNGVIISNKISPAHLEFAVSSIMGSFLGTSGQRCTNTRRIIAHRELLRQLVESFKAKLDVFVASGAIVNPLLGASNDYGYGPLIDADAFNRFEAAKAQVLAEGGEIIGGARLLSAQYPGAYYVEPALALLPSQTAIMHQETFAPILFIAPYEGSVDNGIAMMNAPENAGLVSGIYTLSQKEADIFASTSEAGHVLINSPKGTGTPAFGMGFGGNKHSGVGEILNAADPLAAFTSATHFRRIAQNKDIAMDE
ncbi:MAG: aldehyde dehydrogenase family protein [Alphaproteobacteria bacterium]|nr:aldehyde dehydrogenase family protein [Alphaproteobacteria bacterium]